MISFEKISKEEWLKLSQEEKDYYTLKYNTSVEQRKRIVLIATRAIALLCVLALFYIGYSQIKVAITYGNLQEKYGDEAYCYLCGYHNLRSCDCIYWEQGFQPDNLTKYKEEVGEKNILPCSTKNKENSNFPLIINFSNLE